jgi:hypothetical protein
MGMEVESAATDITTSTRRSGQGWAGLILIAIFWPLNWLLPEATHRTSYLFFPLWLGYILVVDALVERRAGTSMWTRSRRQFGWLFLASAPGWWLFEVINWRTQNWEYVGSGVFSRAEYILLCTISFSTVMPAVFESAELARSFRWVDRLKAGPCLRPTRSLTGGMLVAGLLMLTLVLVWPRYCYPLVWGAVLLILEPINVWLGRATFFDWLNKGDWRPVVALSVGALICGFFWEMWNYYSYPKWVYHTPGAEFLYVFEMPLLGYIGYLPFAWELFALRNFVWPQAPRLRL